MAVTSHGHHIPGTTVDEAYEGGLFRARCGGPGLCLLCSEEAALAPKVENLYHDENTLHIVYKALAEADLSFEQSRAAVDSLQNHGILFRERRS